MKKILTLLILIWPFIAFAHDFKYENGNIYWKKSFTGIPNTTSIVNNIYKDSTITGHLNNYLIDYSSQGIDFMDAPIILNDPVQADVLISIKKDCYEVVVSNIVLKNIDVKRGIVGRLIELEYYMISREKITRDPEKLDILEIMTSDFIKIFGPLKLDN